MPGGPNPSSTTVTVETSKAARLGGYEVTLSRGIGLGGPTGIIDSERTNGAGQVTFINLAVERSVVHVYIGDDRRQTLRRQSLRTAVPVALHDEVRAARARRRATV